MVKIPSIDGLTPVEVKIENNTHKYFSALFSTDDRQGNRLRYAIQFVDPAKLRIELFPTTSFYQLGLLIVDNHQYKFRSASDNQNEQGEFSSEVLQDKIGLQFTIPQLISAVLQDIPSDISGYKSYTDNLGKVFVFSEDNTFIGVFDEKNLMPKEFFYFNNNDLVAKVIIQQEVPKCQMQVVVPRYDARLDIECLMFKTDKQPADARFDLN